ncbi:MAG: type II toxin-antitoxin system HicA family toxin [Oscillochloridaceae bacterium umkhey_bin13]
MPPLPVISGRRCVAALTKLGFTIVRQRGSHIIIQRMTPEGRVTLSVPDHTELDRGTLRSIIRQAGLTVEAFQALLDA